MTENKRFTQKDEDDWEILDRNKHFAYAHSGYQAEKIIQELNELVETNRELYKENKELKAEMEQLDLISKDIVCADIQHQLLKVTDENKKLKKGVGSMTEKKYIYVLEAYAYSDFTTYILTHKTSMSKKMFFKLVKKAQELCETKNYIPDKPYTDYACNMVACLCTLFGFEEFDYPSVSIGVSPKSKCAMWLDGKVIEE